MSTKKPAVAKPQPAKKPKSAETTEERKARHEAACHEVRRQLGRRATAAEVGEREREAVAKSDAEAAA